VKREPTIVTKAQTYPNLRINCIDDEFDDLTVENVTEAPNATCK
jgi:hypothetical protein